MMPVTRPGQRIAITACVHLGFSSHIATTVTAGVDGAMIVNEYTYWTRGTAVLVVYGI